MVESIIKSKDLGIISDLDPFVFEARCPYLGLKHDRATILGFPNVANNCFRHDRPIPVNLKMQSQLCLTEQYEICAIFQQDPALPAQESETLGQEQEADGRLASSIPAWIKRARPVLFAIPVILLILAALVWWPTPGTSVEDNTGNAAPQQKLTTPSEPNPVTGSQADEVESENNQADLKNGSGAATSIQDELETASQADVSPIGAEEDEAAGQESAGFRVLTYD